MEQHGTTVGTPSTSPIADRVYGVSRYDRAGAEQTLRAAKVRPDQARRTADALPDGLPFIYNLESGMPLAPALLYMLRLWLRPKVGMEGARSFDTARAQAYDICDFLEHLDAYGRSYDQVDQELFDTFARNQASAPSARTGRLLSAKTIRRRLAHVAGFLKSKEFQAVGSSTVDRSLTAGGGRADPAQIHPFTAAEWKQLLPHLGPLPSERKPHESSVLRLIVDWSVRTGARRVELVNLPSDLVTSTAHIVSEEPDQTLPLEIKVTKGRIPRPLWVPTDLLEESRIYLESERAEALKATGRSDHGRLFVNPVRSRRHAGAPVNRNTLTGWFCDAVDAADLKRRLVAGSAGRPKLSPFVFHDLRHTFAVWSYVALDLAGRKRPWKIIQARLGHKTLQTTEEVYLAFIEDHEMEISDLLREHYDGWLTDAAA